MMNVLLEKLFSLLPNWLSILIVLELSLLALLLAILLAFLLIQAVLRIQWKSQTVKRFIRICNEGNITGKFLLRVDGPQQELKFQCLLNGKTLPKAPVVPKGFSSQHNQTVQPARALNTAQYSTTVPAVPPQSGEVDGAKKKLAESAEKAKEKSKKGLGIGRLISGIFGTLGSLLPGSLGDSLKEKSADLQKATQDASTKLQMPEQKLKSVEHLKGQVNQLGPGAKEQKTAPGQAGSPHAAPEPFEISETGAEPEQSVGNPAAQVEEPLPSGFLQTPFISPGEALRLELQMDPSHPYRSGEYSFAVLVRQLVLPEMLPQEKLPDSTSWGRVTMIGLSPIYWVLSFLMVLCAVVLNGTWAILFVSWLAGFVL